MKTRFVRWGGLSPVKQKGYDPSMPAEHCPPARRGVYAFVYPYIERFLIGSHIFLPHRMEWVRDKKGNRVNGAHPDHARLVEEKGNFSVLERELPEDGDYDKTVWLIARHVRPRLFDYRGDLWHHLGHRLHPGEVKARKGSWVKSSYADFCRAFEAEVNWLKRFKRRNGYGCSHDHLEVFIEKV